MDNPLLCPYCNAAAEFVDSIEVYRKSYGMIYICRPCQAWVGVHGSSKKPLGRLANAELRKAKQKAHAAFDPLWEEKMRRTGCHKKSARSVAYAWLAKKMQIDIKDCHIGMFDEYQCEQVAYHCGPFLKRIQR